MGISEKDQDRYAHMAAVEEVVGGQSESGTSVHGTAAAALGQQFLLDALGSVEEVERAVGRPRVDKAGAKGEGSPLVQVRITAARKRELEALRVQMHRKSTSDVVRAAIDEYVERHRLSA
ncbi:MULTISPECIES: hypothetical protein [unclassified Leifsonia]|uniref:hypothetical protein n=1 Tax=unclassified Leifsonia TaxID=2663824 RepID=UPI0008A76288|nr:MULTISPECIES: hypothetical protein [unclassified Leifsonia]SEH57177.1 hypothetical protein SAMN04515694_101161 [Leifsonia sp. CL154]SFL21668.1 hypothetical protein SAMN04515692_101318 [Leifsonia sp. CL147]